jgi:2C-methyl-D-erythritol 2,4-cyclodiphosphate synthase
VGGLFPDDDPTWRDADSVGLLGQVVPRLGTGWRVGNVDCAVVPWSAPR